LPYENSRVHWDFNSQSGNSLGSVGVHSLTLSYTLARMKFDSRASFLTCTFVNPCLGCERKARVAIHLIIFDVDAHVSGTLIFVSLVNLFGYIDNVALW